MKQAKNTIVSVIILSMAFMATSAMAEPDFTAVTAAIGAAAVVTAIGAVAAIKILPGVATWGFNKVIGWFR